MPHAPDPSTIPLSVSEPPVATRDPVDFFVSYASPDKEWALWVSWVLKLRGYHVIVDAWDFRPGHNFVLMMQYASSAARHTIIILSPTFLESSNTQPEWAAAFAGDPAGWKRKLIPIRIRDCAPRGMLQQVIYIDLVDIKNEADALVRVLDGVRSDTLGPRPAFPGPPVT